jgi:heptosyltransferase-2
MEPKSILLLCIGRLGDYIVATPAIRSIRKRFPKARIVLVVGPRAEALAGLDANVDAVWSLAGLARALQNIALALRVVSGFDCAIDLNPAFSRSAAILTLLSRARQRISFIKRGSSILYTQALPQDPDREHFIDRYRQLAKTLGADFEEKMEVSPLPQDSARAEKILTVLGLAPKRPRIGIHPGDFKKFDNRWPEEKFKKLAQKIIALGGLDLIFIAGPGEETAVKSIVSSLPQVHYLPPQPLPVAAAVLSRLDFLICNNSGTLQLAAAVGTPTFSFDSQYNLLCWRPRGPHGGIESPQWDGCRDISVEDAWNALKPQLEKLINSPPRA